MEEVVNVINIGCYGVCASVHVGMESNAHISSMNPQASHCLLLHVILRSLENTI